MTTVLGSETYPVWLDRDYMVKPFMQFMGIDTFHDGVLDVIIAGVCTRAAKLTGGRIARETFGPADGLGKFDGAGGLYSGYIMLPRTPVIQMGEVIEYQGSNPVILSEIDPASGGDGYQINYRTGRLTRVLGGVWNRPFFPGSNNVWVTWDAGYDPVPADWIQAGLEWVAAVYRNTQQTSTAAPSATGEYDPATGTDLLYQGIPNRITSVFSTNARVGIR